MMPGKTRLEQRFMVIVGIGLLFATICIASLAWWTQTRSIEDRLRSLSSNEMQSLDALVNSAMIARLSDSNNVAITVFDGWFKQRNADYPGELWSVWSPPMAAQVSKTDATKTIKRSHDAIDEEVLRSGKPIGRFVGDNYRYSTPVILGASAATSRPECMACHGEPMGQKKGDVIAVFSSSVSAKADFVRRDHAVLWLIGAAAAFSVLLLLAIQITFRKVVTQPLTGMVGAMTTLAEGKTDCDIPNLGRSDEIGATARAVQVFKESMIEADRLSRQQGEQDKKERRAHAFETLTSGFRISIESMANALTDVSGEMKSAALSMSNTANETNHNSLTVAGVIESASENVSSVAASTKRLTTTINQMGKNINAAAEIARSAVSEAEHTDVVVHGLSEAAERIGAIVDMIRNVANQTHLLAINAAVEAARAGEIGTGFAVVASEVKSLADQTAKATTEIANEIRGIQDRSSEAVAAIKSISTTVREISVIAATLSQEVAQQLSVTQKIAQIAHETEQDTTKMTRRISTVKLAAEKTGVEAGHVLGSAGRVAEQSGQISAEVAKFIEKIGAI